MKTAIRYSKIFCLLCLLVSCIYPALAEEKLLLTLQAEPSRVRWQHDFVVSLEIYGSDPSNPPGVAIAGLDQFRLNGQGRNLLQVPGGKTVKWIFTYNLTAVQDGVFQLGPAIAQVEGRTFSSNRIFITVEAPPGAKKKPEERKDEEKRMPTTIIHSEKELGDRVLILMQASKNKVYRNEPITVTLRLLSQLPIDSLRFTEEAEFPGFLKYDFPFSASPKGQKIEYKKKTYVSYELQKFLIFPLKAERLELPAVGCNLRVRVPSGAFAAADLILDAVRSSNALSFDVLPLPDSRTELVGEFLLSHEIISDLPQSKIFRLTLEGTGQVSTFEFPDLSGRSYTISTVSHSAGGSIKNSSFRSKKTADYEVIPAGSQITSAMLPEVRISYFNPATRTISWLTLPQLPLKFAKKPVPTLRVRRPLPSASSRLESMILALIALSSLAYGVLLMRPVKKISRPRLLVLLRKKNLKLQVSKNSAKILYQQIHKELLDRDGSETSLIEVLKKHIPTSDWSDTLTIFKKLESNAFAQSTSVPLQYGELKNALGKVERLWLQ